ncbi:solute carrier family 41 member 1 isoform X1 [Biomphalaria pfeifferi]|uniref:Solute carrier family 41 member 1 isoform X1 n=1 Tax=Biomphalaria pfeifferi TaxID=112525 RepID=A0AAD8C0F5_BIOPF|nr:solute carrier family 41 member 1 isoform X1 [Biomphalaria pfeifferi]
MGDVALEGLRQRSRPLKQSDMVPRIMAVSENEDHGIRDVEVFELKDRGQTSDMAVSAPVEIHYSPVQAPIAETNLDVEDDLSCDDSRQLLSPDQNSDDASVIDDEGEVYNINSLLQSLPGEESSISIVSQVTLPFIIAGFGMVGAGMVLDIVQHWTVFTQVKEIFILVPALLGLKGNLEMTLASRLSTQANLGHMDSRKELLKMAQAIVVGFLSSLTAMVLGWIPKGDFNIQHGLLLCASSVFTAALASLILGSIMVLVVLLSRYFKINPDNVATPIAASLGDLVTLSILAWVGNLLYEAIGKQVWLAPTIIVVFALLLPLWVVICIRNKYTNDVIYSGWVPVLSAMMISSLGGLILDFTVANYDGIAVFQPVINGVGGNLAAVHASRISTSLHQKGVHSKAARVLTLLVIPGHLLFSFTIFYLRAGHTSSSLLFQCFYLSAALLQVVLLIYIASWLVPLIWVKGSDPDNVAIPYLTAIGDLLGTAFLAVAFHFLFLLGDRDADVSE